MIRPICCVFVCSQCASPEYVCSCINKFIACHLMDTGKIWVWISNISVLLFSVSPYAHPCIDANGFCLENRLVSRISFVLNRLPIQKMTFNSLYLARCLSCQELKRYTAPLILSQRSGHFDCQPLVSLWRFFFSKYSSICFHSCVSFAHVVSATALFFVLALG